MTPFNSTSSRNTVTPIVAEIEKFIAQYVTLADSIYSLPIALWVIGTYLWPDMDAFPYLVITAGTKRAGKTRLAECMSFVASNPRFAGAMGTASASLFKLINTEKPTLFMDEAESMSGESANNVRSILNMGYRKGQKVVRVTGNGDNAAVAEYDVYCPKVFILIGDMFDTVRDRSIIIRMKRGTPRNRFTYENAKMEGEALRDSVSDLIDRRKLEFTTAFNEHKGLQFLTDRDEEIWLPLFAVCQVVCPDRMKELSKNAVDIATEKTQEAAQYVNLMGEEGKTEDDEYATKLLQDMVAVVGAEKNIGTVDALERLKALPTAPWRKFRGDGLNINSLADLLSRFSVRPTTISIGSGRKNRTILKGYKKADLVVAMKAHLYTQSK